MEEGFALVFIRFEAPPTTTMGGDPVPNDNAQEESTAPSPLTPDVPMFDIEREIPETPQ